MRHVNPLTKRPAVSVPYEIHALFLNEVMYPSIMMATPQTRGVYVNYSLEEWRWRASSNSQFSGKSKTVVVTNPRHLCKCMRKVLDVACIDKPELRIFKSFFFCIQARGIKLHTTTDIYVAKTDGENLEDDNVTDEEVERNEESRSVHPFDVEGGDGVKSAYQLMQKQFPYIDFEEAQKRENGQMVMDLGMGFIPNPPQGSPVVCMWSLPYLSESYGAAGYQKPTFHSHNTMGNYGGCQAEMTQGRAALVQQVFRSSYMLSYEVTRRIRGGHISLCSDRDAYHIHPRFTSSIGDYLKMLKGAEEKPYSHGAREEIRGSVAAVCEIIDGVDTVVSG